MTSSRTILPAGPHRATTPAAEPRPVRVGIVGAGLMARAHIGDMVTRQDTVIGAICDPNRSAAERAIGLVAGAGAPAPAYEPEWQRFLEVTARAEELDAVMLLTPHSLHHAQVRAALEAGLDVLVEKPMVLTAAEAEDLIRVRDRTGRLLVVAFQGSLSPRIRAAAAMIRSGALGALRSVDALVWQDWVAQASGTWRMDPALAGGGFMFDTGAHMLNTVADLVGEDVTQVSAWLETDGNDVDVRGAVVARLASGALVTMNGCGVAIPSLGSDIRVFCEGATLRTGIWGERLEIQRTGSRALRPVRSVRPKTVWAQFLDVRAGREPNPSPPEIGLRMARLWDAIRTSAAHGGSLVTLPVAEPVR